MCRRPRCAAGSERSGAGCCSARIYFRGELAAAAAAAGDGGQWVNVNPAPALFSDGAAAVVLCNSLALALASRDRDTPGQGKGKGVYAVRDWWSGVTPDTSEEITYRPTESGFLVRLSRDIPHLICNAIRQPFETLLRRNGIEGMEARDFSWAVHPGGLAVIRAVRDALQLDDEDLRATMEVYTRKGNTSSVAVLAVLDEVRKEGGKEDVLACSFGPGVTTEMMLMKRL
ncbi:hypothetical protein CNMCM5793_002730 [Aspergillus hiratsukae]|uniref:Chalcone/stilbene synthase C-terminal domain-containing protein n=1 Tax=Aspergillus hiratsukae TaxID=1194566 RepID=A0A8H6Q901_9EURO|nr:hypothetical protein CNMCM5793_002730 [Aspergillus hiratsukae]KAF7168009.1 hypothetical protein CNMCM6106_003331 [Aspergillus hiratsukae]